LFESKISDWKENGIETAVGEGLFLDVSGVPEEGCLGFLGHEQLEPNGTEDKNVAPKIKASVKRRRPRCKNELNYSLV